jgi:hypothetical protein
VRRVARVAKRLKQRQLDVVRAVGHCRALLLVFLDGAVDCERHVHVVEHVVRRTGASGVPLAVLVRHGLAHELVRRRRVQVDPHQPYLMREVHQRVRHVAALHVEHVARRDGLVHRRQIGRRQGAHEAADRREDPVRVRRGDARRLQDLERLVVAHEAGVRHAVRDATARERQVAAVHGLRRVRIGIPVIVT